MRIGLLAEMDIRKQVGANLARIRREKGLSQEALAFECDLHRTYVSGVERGIRNPTVVVLNKIAKALRVEPYQLLAPVPATKTRR